MGVPVGFSQNANVSMTCEVYSKSTHFDFYRIADTVKLNTLVCVNDDSVCFVAGENGYIYRSTRDNTDDNDRHDTWTLVQRATHDIIFGFATRNGVNLVGDNGQILYITDTNAATGTFSSSASLSATEAEDLYLCSQDSAGDYIASRRNFYTYSGGDSRYIRRTLPTISTGWTPIFLDLKTKSRYANNRVFVVGYEVNNSDGTTRPLMGHFNSNLNIFYKKSFPSTLNNTIFTCFDHGTDSSELVIGTQDGRVLEVPHWDQVSTMVVHSLAINTSITKIEYQVINGVENYFFLTNSGVHRFLPATSDLTLLERIDTPVSLLWMDSRLQCLSRNGFFFEGLPTSQTRYTYTTNPISFTTGGIFYTRGGFFRSFPKITDSLKNTSNNVTIAFDGNSIEVQSHLLNNDNILGQRIVFRIHEMNTGFDASLRSVPYFTGIISSVTTVEDKPDGISGSVVNKEIIVSCESYRGSSKKISWWEICNLRWYEKVLSNRQLI